MLDLSEAAAFEAAIAVTPEDPAWASCSDQPQDTTSTVVDYSRYVHNHYDWTGFTPTDYCVIPLTKGYFAVVSPEDYDRISAFDWKADVQLNQHGSISKIYAYRYCTPKERARGSPEKVYLHRCIAKVQYANRSIIVDHRSGDTLDNRRSNLRRTNQSQNMANAVRASTSGLPRGVEARYRKGPDGTRVISFYRARVRIRGKVIWPKTKFSTPQAAARWYTRVHALIFPEACRVNSGSELPPALVFPALVSSNIPF